MGGFGRPILRKLAADIEAKGGEDWFFDQMASGRSLQSISEDFDISRRMLYRWRDIPEYRIKRKELWADARRDSAGAHVEKGLADLDSLTEGTKQPTSAEVSARTSQANYRKWFAGTLNPEYADKGIELNFSVGELHLRALQHTRALGPIEEAEIIEDDDTEAIKAPAGIPLLEGEVPSSPEPPATSALPAELSELMT